MGEVKAATSIEDATLIREALVRALALVAIQQADLTLAHDALATAHEDVLTVVRGGTRDLGKTANGLDVAMQALVISHATRGQRLANVSPSPQVTQPKQEKT